MNQRPVSSLIMRVQTSKEEIAACASFSHDSSQGLFQARFCPWHLLINASLARSLSSLEPKPPPIYANPDGFSTLRISRNAAFRSFQKNTDPLLTTRSNEQPLSGNLWTSAATRKTRPFVSCGVNMLLPIFSISKEESRATTVKFPFLDTSKPNAPVPAPRSRHVPERTPVLSNAWLARRG